MSKDLHEVRILVVDDDVDNCVLMTTIFEIYGIKTITATSAVEGLEMLFQWEPDLLICDLVMPQVNGYSLIRKIRTLDSPLGIIPAIAVTGVDTEEGRNLALKYGFQTYLIKPIDPNELIIEIAKVVNIQLENQQDCQNVDEMISTDESLFASDFKQGDKLPMKIKPLNKDFDKKVVAKAKELRTHSKHLQIQYNDLGSRFIAFKAHFTQIKQKFGLIKPHVNVQ